MAKEGNEFNVKVVRGTSFEEQTKWVIGSIKANTYRWHKRLIENGHCSFQHFFYYEGGPRGIGWRRKQKDSWVETITDKLKEVENEL